MPFRQRPLQGINLNINRVEIGEPWQVPRVWLECRKLEYRQETTVEGRLRILFNPEKVAVEVNHGEPLIPIEEEVGSWSLTKLKEVIRRLVRLR